MEPKLLRTETLAGSVRTRSMLLTITIDPAAATII